jgi:hypothetical protein
MSSSFISVTERAIVAGKLVIARLSIFFQPTESLFLIG